MIQVKVPLPFFIVQDRATSNLLWRWETKKVSNIYEREGERECKEAACSTTLSQGARDENGCNKHTRYDRGYPVGINITTLHCSGERKEELT